MTTDLIKKLEALTGSDQRVDRDVWDYFFGDKAVDHSMPSAPFTSSLDAAIARAERVLPEWKRQLLEDFNGKWIARICSQSRELFSTDYLRETELGGSPNPAIALVIAILKAKEASQC